MFLSIVVRDDIALMKWLTKDHKEFKELLMNSNEEWDKLSKMTKLEIYLVDIKGIICAIPKLIKNIVCDVAEFYSN